jgi:hypothetical protein
MIGPFFSVGPCKETILPTPATIDAFVGNIQAQLALANWTLVSTFAGHDGTLGINMRTFPTPLAQTAILTLFWDGTTTPFIGDAVMTFQMSDGAGGNKQDIGFVTLHATKTFTMIWGPHQFFIFSTFLGTAFQLNYVMGGVPVTLGNGQTYWGCGDNASLGGAPSFTNTLAMTAGDGTWSYLLNGTAAQRGSAGVLPLQLIPQRSHNFAFNDPITFADGTVPVIEPILVMLQQNAVYLWDAVVISHQFNSNFTFQYDLRTFTVITLGFSLGALAVVSNDSGKGLGPGYAY